MEKGVMVIASKTAEKFFKEVRSYIEINPLKVASQSVNSSDIEKKPFVHIQCNKAKTSACPSRNDSSKECHNCAHAEHSLKELAQIATNYQFRTSSTLSGDGINKYQDIGVISMNLSDGQDVIHMEIDGEESGMITLSNDPYRRDK